MSNFDQSQMLCVGTTLAGRYRIERYLASGGFGNTYVALDIRFNGLVAVKEFFMRGTNHRHTDGSTVVVSNADNREGFQQQLDKFRREAQRIFQLRNDHIIHVIDLFDANGTSYYVMDFVEGESLSARVKRQPLTEAETRRVAGQLLDALGAVHAAGFYHLDVKPGNIMVDARGHCTLIDFGASKQMSAMERTSLSASGMAYTPGYAPIEQEGQRLKSIGPWTDLYAVGATLYHLLTGQTPPEVDPDDTADDGRMFNYPEGVSLQIQKAVSRLMNPSPRRRPQSVEQARALLDDRPAAPVVEQTMTAPQPPHVARRQHQEAEAAEVVVEATDAAGAARSGRRWLWISLAAVVGLVAVLLLVLRPGGGGEEFPVAPTAQAVEAEVGAAQETLPVDKSFTVGNVSFTMKAVEGGTFTMGATPEQDSPDDDEHPAHNVTLSSYSIGATEVTQALWQTVMGSNPSHFKGDNLPVERVSWNDCKDFIRKLNAATEGQRPEGRAFRLPTEAEWEFAARGGNKSRHTKYSGSSDPGSVAWFADNSGRNTHPVAGKAPNELGLYDMSGNVWEWCQDWYDKNYYAKSPSTDPRNDESASYRVDRGGSWHSNARRCRVSHRSRYTPDKGDRNLGLRLAL